VFLKPAGENYFGAFILFSLLDREVIITIVGFEVEPLIISFVKLEVAYIRTIKDGYRRTCHTGKKSNLAP
jgi:hypothetical protein